MFHSSLSTPSSHAAIAIKIDDPGPVFFRQKRIAQDMNGEKQFFQIFKYRSMKMCTPHDTPTHLLENPEQYITKIGKFLRKTSLDELPQIFNIFFGQMSIIGPRPALWNQDDLYEEREKYGANSVVPGLTGWAQINGRDELEIDVKAKLTSEEKDLKNAQFIIVAVPTPVNTDHTPDLTPVIGASEIVGRNLTKGAYVVYESTVYPGCTEDVCIPILERESGLKCGVDFKIGYSPERINPGDKIHRLENITKIVSGCDDESAKMIKAVYDMSH